jgi:hypothetical protein
MLITGPVVDRFNVKDSDGNIRGAVVVEITITSNEVRRDGMSVPGRVVRQVQFEDRSAILTPRKTDPESFEVSGVNKIVWKVGDSED